MIEAWGPYPATRPVGTAVRDAGVAAAAAAALCLPLTVALRSVPALAGAVAGIGIVVAAGASMVRRRGRWSGPADRVSLVRAVLAAGCATLAAAIVTGDLAARSWPFLLLAATTLLLDAADGVVARRTGTASAAGGRLDGELDAAVYLVLSVALVPTVGWWVLAIGLLRYAFGVAGALRPRLREPLAFSRFRRVVAAAQAVFLGVALAPVVPVEAARAGLAVALALLTASFGRDVVELERRGAERAGPTVRLPG